GAQVLTTDRLRRRRYRADQQRVQSRHYTRAFARMGRADPRRLGDVARGIVQASYLRALTAAVFKTVWRLTNCEGTRFWIYNPPNVARDTSSSFGHPTTPAAIPAASLTWWVSNLGIQSWL